jgi:hypothetical protein
MTDWISKQWNSFLGLFGMDDKQTTGDNKQKDAKEDIARLQKNIDRLQKLDDEGVLQEGGQKRLEKMKTNLSSLKGQVAERGASKSKLTVEERNKEIKELEMSAEESDWSSDYGIAEAEEELAKKVKQHSFRKKQLEKDLDRALSKGLDTIFLERDIKTNDESLEKKKKEVSDMKARLEMLKAEQIVAETSKGELARGGFIVNQPTYLPNSGVVVGEHGTYSGGAAYGGIADGGPEAVIPLSSTRAGAFIDPMARSVAGSVLNQLAMSRVGMDNSGGGGANVVTGNDMSSNQVSNNTTVINNPSPIGQTLPDEGRDFVSKVA